ncbi:ABC transporter ATP-binding protein [Marinagarivorans cellulosilyticus]|uniref:ABC-2 type transport system ATP-binding protein n=1 Tax=Marinagarivorans cellulosilyticus TaxID=2721545 RepID=A0AAN2BKP2_9GAMM|nr:ATP-binding cassette domain-containing protein [Marinagarivorans cellulosilyticus]BCD98221.1 ABC-2 type transport system ATP-binding protein [Marinagarivorans cellulosilyticus]
MLSVHQLSRTYGSFVAVDNVSFSINKGEIVGLLGHNGAGKTSIMKVISGYLEADTGRVTVDGVDLQNSPKLVQKSLGYLPESLPVYPEMTVADYLDYAADLKGLKGEEKASELRRAIKATDITEKLLVPIATLSRGYKQRVGVAQAILGRPKLLILDEPTNGLDPEQTQHMRDLICEVAKDATVILSTHIMQEVEAICSRVLMLNAGSLALDAKLDELRASHHLLLQTSLNKNDVLAMADWGEIDSVKLLHTVEGGSEFRVALDNSAKPKLVAARIAAFIVAQNAELYALQPEQRNLETLFKEVNQGYKKEGLNHAA